MQITGSRSKCSINEDEKIIYFYRKNRILCSYLTTFKKKVKQTKDKRKSNNLPFRRNYKGTILSYLVTNSFIRIDNKS